MEGRFGCARNALRVTEQSECKFYESGKAAWSA
jgi:hypothetical protein